METKFPFILQNLHRYFLYLAFIPLFFLWLDAAFAVVHGGGITIGLGVAILFVNAFLLTGYSLSCHSCRHAVGGRLRHFSKHPVRYKLWTAVSRLNLSHARYAWLSLFSVALTDLYIYLLAQGTFDDPRFF